MPFQRKQEFELQKLASFDIDEWHDIQRIAVIESKNQVVIYGRRLETSPYSLYMTQHNEAGEFVETLMDYPCQYYSYLTSLFTVVRGGKDLFAVSCCVCKNIKLFDLETWTTNITFTLPSMPFITCSGPNDSVFMSCMDGKALQLDTSFYVAKVFELNHCRSMCYLPVPHNALVVRSWKEIAAISTQNGCQLWKRTFCDFFPDYVLFYQKENVLVVSDLFEPKVLILNTDGGTMQIIHVPDIHSINQIGLSNDQLITIQRTEESNYHTLLSYYSLKANLTSTKSDVIHRSTGNEFETEGEDVPSMRYLNLDVEQSLPGASYVPPLSPLSFPSSSKSESVSESRPGSSLSEQPQQSPPPLGSATSEMVVGIVIFCKIPLLRKSWAESYPKGVSERIKSLQCYELK